MQEELLNNDFMGTQMSNSPEVLIVDDDLMNIEVIKAMLSMQNTESDTAMSGIEAL